jgi:ABC-type Fe3+-hydroxamate transport system substrate-binding protein
VTIVGLRPDLILVSMEGNVRDDFIALVSLGIPVFVTNPRTLDGIHKSINDIGFLTGNSAGAASLVQSMKSTEDSIVALASSQPHVRLYLFVSLQPVIVVGKGTFLNELIGLVGGTNLAADAPSTYPMLSREAIIENQPDDLLFTSDILTGKDDLVALYPEWKELKAIRSGRIFGVDADIISRPGPRVVEALKLLYHIIHAGTQ